MVDRRALLSELQKLLKKLEADLLERSESAEVPDVGRKLRDEYASARAAERTAQSYEQWRSDAITQVAAAWVLSGVFVRFLEDNELIPTPKIAGPGDRLKRARDEHELYFRSHPTLTDRDYLLAVFDGLTKHAATTDVFGEHNPIRDLPNWLSGDAAGALIAFFQTIDPNTGVLVHDFTDPEWDTRFLGDLYQDLSEEARKKYALLQTPVFVEEFILDRTLDPAIEEFGLARMGYETRLLPDGRLHPDDRFKMIDPACGSGHFLLGSFARLVDRWRRKEPGGRVSVLVQRALDSVHGVDLNPYAIAIARFRLLLAALKECGVGRLKDAPGFEIHLACGDSLLHGSPGGDQATMGWSTIDHVYQPEDKEALDRLLRPGRYHAVVANPPYITPKDAALNAAYRERYATCHRQYSLAVPFLERIFSLAVDGGFTGQITANSFMKREFGKKLIEEYLPRVDLTHVIDSQLAHIPGHGIPTVLIFGRNRAPVSHAVRLVGAIKRENVEPTNPARGLVWSAIVTQVDQPGSESEFASVSDSPREMFHKHPWSIGGGGAAELKDLVDDNAKEALHGAIETISSGLCITREDEAYLIDEETLSRNRISAEFRIDSVQGEHVRDWMLNGIGSALFPYDQELRPIDPVRGQQVHRFLWPYQELLWRRKELGGDHRELGRTWWEWNRFLSHRFLIPLSITYSEVATHNHFAFDRGGKVFNRTAPVIKLPREADEDDYLALLGLLNTSTACFWLKQVCHCKGGGGIGGGIKVEMWERFYAINGTKLQQFPLPVNNPLPLAKQLDELASLRVNYLPTSVLRSCVPTHTILARDCAAADVTLGRMIAAQEELDWECYRHYGLIEEDLTLREPPPLKLGQRAFEIVLGRKMAAGETHTRWFELHNSTPTTELPAEWPDDYRQLVERRIALIESDPNIRLIEQPEYKRRWNTEPWESQLEQALRGWLLDRLESYFDFDGRMKHSGQQSAVSGQPNKNAESRSLIEKSTVISVGKLADIARRDTDFLHVGEIYRDDAAFDVTKLVTELVEAESVPLLPVLRYKATGLRKREEWENTWTLQRREDAIDARAALPKDDPRHLSELDANELKKKEVGTIPVPPKYTSADFLKSDYWRLRGKLDVPKERWVSFPHCEGEDGSLMVAWDGYDHLQLARAISAYYVDVQERLGGRDDPRLVPLLACLIELLPWLKQWHNEVDPEFGVPMGDYFEGFLQEESRNMGLTLDEIKAWQPPQRARGRGRRSAKQ